ncbi:MAG: helix-turn-helix transcriptional regulator [Chloroflexia bacterium]|nr:helix-turn-helix transcriptional regulator [Chloroflexia bacterium]
MSYFGRNIRKIRNAKKISQTAFADLFHLKRGSIGAYEEGRAEAKIDTIIEIADYFRLSLDQLLRKELTINEIYHIQERSRKIAETKTPENPEQENNLQKQVDVEHPLSLQNRLKTIEDKLKAIEELLKRSG